MSFFVVERDFKNVHLVSSYVRDKNGTEAVLCDDWSGSHIIGKDCHWCKTDTVLERIWNTTKSTAGFKMLASNVGCTEPEIKFFIELKKKKVAKTLS